jgi:hypothetical protein
MKSLALALAAVGCATDPKPHTVVDNVAFPADLKVVGDQVYSLLYDGSILTISTKDHSVRTIVPPVRQVAANEISVDLETYQLVVTADAIYWTSNATGTPQVQRAALDGSGATVLAHGISPFDALIATDSGVCWAGDLTIKCEHGTLATVLTAPSAMVADGATLYFATPSSAIGAGGLYAIPLAGGAVQTLATGLNNATELAIVQQTDGRNLLWADSSTSTCVQGICTSNVDASLHDLTVDELAGGSFVRTARYAQIDSFVVAPDKVYFTADSRLRVYNPNEIGEDTPVANVWVTCNALGVAGKELYCADAVDHNISTIAISD